MPGIDTSPDDLTATEGRGSSHALRALTGSTATAAAPAGRSGRSGASPFSRLPSGVRIMAAAAPPPGAGAIESCDALYDPLAPDVLTDPYPCFARLRAAGAVLWHDRLASWLVTDHATCSEVLRRTDVFASDFRRIGEEVPDAALSVQM